MNSKCSFLCLHKCLNESTYYTFCTKCGIIMKNKEVISRKVPQANHPTEIEPLEILDIMRLDSFEIKKFKHQMKTQAWTSMIQERNSYLKTLRLYTTLCKYSEKTFHLSSLYMDIITLKLKLNKQNDIYENNLLIIGTMLLASKFIENEFNPNVVETHQMHFSFHDLECILSYEEICLRLLDYRLNYPTAYDFAQFFMNHGIVLVTEDPATRLEAINQRVMDTLTTFHSNEKFIDFEPMQVACACINVTREYFRLNKWEDTFYKYYGIRPSFLKECSTHIQSPNTYSTIYSKKKFTPESKYRLSMFETKLNISGLDNSYDKDSFETSTTKVGVKTIFSRDSHSTASNFMLNEYKNNLKGVFKKQNEDIIVSEEISREEDIQGEESHPTQILETNTVRVNNNANRSILYGKRKNFVNEKNLNLTLNKPDDERNKKINTESANFQTNRIPFKLQNYTKKMNISSYIIKDTNEDYSKKVISNTSTASNSLNSVSRNTFTYATKFLTNKISDNSLSQSLNSTNKIEKIKNVLSNRHNFTFQNLNHINFDITKVIETSRNSFQKNQ